MGQKNWTIEYDVDFKKEWKKIDPSVQKKVLEFFSERLRTQEDPKLFAKPLSGNPKHFWRYRIGDYRIICEFHESNKVIYLVRIAHRREVYKKLHLIYSSS